MHMGRTFILGDETLRDFTQEHDYSFISFPERRLSSHEEIHDYMMSNLGNQDIDTIVLDADTDLLFCLDLAMHFRLSLDSLGLQALAPIVFISDLSLDALLKFNDSAQIFLSSSVYLSPASQLSEGISNAVRMRIEDYQKDFLNKITINPPLSTLNDRHGLANQWGAGVVYRILCGKRYDGDLCPALTKAQKNLYFKYILACTVDDIQTLAIPEKRVAFSDNLTVRSAGRRILLIDDMADRGWALVLKEFFQDAQIDTISETILEFDDFSDEAKRRIVFDEYDLYLLDLRLGGDKEEDIYDTSAFSGMKVLRRIKSINRGRQVIMFTASNKAWNFKRLLDTNAGANGYYIKEAPSFKFSESFSKKSLEALKEEVLLCYKKDFLKGFYSFINEDVQAFDGNELFEECNFQLKVAFQLAESASSETQYRYAYISLIQVFEILSKYILSSKTNENDKSFLSMRTMDEMAIETVRNIHPDPLNNLIYVQDEHSLFEKGTNIDFSQFEKLSAIYLQYLQQSDNGILYIVNQLVHIRNRVMHGTEKEQKQDDTKSSTLPYVSFCEKYLPYMPIFREPEAHALLLELTESGLLKEHKKKDSRMFIFSKRIVNGPVGIKLVLFSLKEFFKAFN